MTVTTVAPVVTTATDRPTQVRCNAITKAFSNDTFALRGIDLHCPAGAITVLLGPSGCGKTTLLRCIAGLETPSDGNIHLGHRDVTHLDPRARGVAMVFQNYGLYPNKSAYGNIEYPLRRARVPKKQRQARIEHVANMLRITHLLDRKPAQLSGGQRQRVGIGRALVREPAVLLMDEPLSSLDAELRVSMRTELRALQRKLGTTMVYVTHDQAEALALADQLVVLRDGHIEQIGEPAEVFTSPSTTFVAGFLGAMNLLEAQPLNLPPGTVGIRPEDLIRGTSPGDLTLSGPVVDTDLTGTERLVHFRCGQQTARIRIRADEPVPTEITAHVRADRIHHFDTDGNRIGER
ncbi:ABC transporter ATP-binding protein [Nocardia sp. NPDC059239]|uniref:ABC transporter ATP-binding protein n=1 Tax=Nocardia sp. NPDC059239 TaxID=3346785 RepID=UPI0036A84FAB